MTNIQADWDFFLAHAAADKETAESLYGYLVEHSRVFLDSQCLRLGDEWDKELANAQRRSLVTAVLVSAHTEDAYYQREEVAAAIAFAREDPNSHRVVPIYIGTHSNDSRIPYGLRLKHGIKLDDDCSLAETAGKLLDLKRSLPAGTPPREGVAAALNTSRSLPRRRERIALLRWIIRVPDEFDAYFRALWTAGFGKEKIQLRDVASLETTLRVLIGDCSRIVEELPHMFNQSDPAPEKRACFAEVLPAFQRECTACFDSSRHLIEGLSVPAEDREPVRVPFSMLYSSLEVDQHLRILRMCAEELLNQFPIDDVEEARRGEPGSSKPL